MLKNKSFFRLTKGVWTTFQTALLPVLNNSNACFLTKGCNAPVNCASYKFIVGKPDMEVCGHKIKCLKNQTMFTTNGRASSYCHVHELPYVNQLKQYTGLNTWHGFRDTLVGIGFSGYGHGRAKKLGYEKWRKDLKKMCWDDYKMYCKSLFPNMAGTNILPIMILYNKSVFCLQPPGDMIARSAIIDSLVMGCIPVLLEKEQMNLWKNYWDPWKSSIFIDMKKSTSKEVFETLINIPRKKIFEIREYNSKKFKNLVYTNEKPNALDVLRRLINV